MKGALTLVAAVVAGLAAFARVASVVEVGGVPRIAIDGQPIPAMAVLPNPRAEPGTSIEALKAFADCGIALSSDVWTMSARTNSPSTWWLGEGVYDWRFFDALAHGLTAASPSGLIFPRLKIDPPAVWIDAHPEETSAGKVRVDSVAWRTLYRRMLKDAVAHVEASDYADRVIGYQLGALHCGEWILYPLDRNLLPPVAGDPKDPYPPQTQTAERRRRLREISDGVADALVDAASTLRTLTHGQKLIGAFFGYFAVSHASLQRVYSSGVLDFFAAPPRYFQARESGHGGRSQNYFQATSRLHGCVFFEESDFRTFLSDAAHAPPNVTRRRPLDESVGILRRTIGNVLTGGHENWWFLIGGNRSYDHPMLMDTIRRGAEVGRETLTAARWRPAEVAVFTSAGEYATSAAAEDLNLCDTLKMDFNEEVLPACGVPFDAYELGDIENPRLPDYKVYVFPNAFTLTETQRAKIRELVGRPGKSAVWLGRPGYYRGESSSFENVAALTNGLNGVVFPEEPTAAVLREALRTAGTHVWIETPDVLAAGRGFLMVHAASAGVKRIRLPETSDLVEIFGASCERRGVRGFDEPMKHGETRVWRMTPQENGFLDLLAWTGASRLPAPGTPAFAAAEARERQSLARMKPGDAVAIGGVPLVRQTQMRWRVRDGETGKVLATDVPQATVLAYEALMKEEAIIPETCSCVLFETWIRSPDDRTVACLVDFTPRDGGVWVNDVPVASVDGASRMSSVRFRAGWNRVCARVRRSSPCVATGLTFCPVEGAPGHLREVADFTYSASPPLHAFVQIWGGNLVRDRRAGTEFRDIPVSTGHFYRVGTEPAVDGVVRFIDATRSEYGRVRLSAARQFYPPPGATAAEVTLDAAAKLRFYEDPEQPAVPVPHPDALPYDDSPTDAPTDRFQREIDAAARGGGVVRVPSGVWHVKPLVLRSDVTLELAEDAVLLASENPNDYAPSPLRRAFIYAEGATNVAIRGKGTLDGRGYAFREMGRNMTGESQPQTLPKLMCFNRCKNVTLEDFTYRRGGAWGCHLCNSDGVTMRRVTCFNHVNATNDGIDIESANVLIEDCDIDADDDAIAVKSESDPSFAVTNVVVRNCRLASMAYPFKVGTGSYGDVMDILVEDCAFSRTKMNHRFPWSKLVAGITNDLSGICGIGLQCVDGGRLKNVTVRNVAIEGYGVPLAVRLGRRHAPPAGRETCLRNVLVENVTAFAEGPTASSICGSDGLEVENVTLRNVRLTLAGGATPADVAEPVANDKGYPGPNMFGSILPSAGLYVRHVHGLVLDRVDFRLQRPDGRPLTDGN